MRTIFLLALLGATPARAIEGVPRFIGELLAESGFTPTPCAEVIDTGTIINRGIVQSREYTGITWRMFSDLEAFFGPYLREHIATLRNARVLLPGGGHGVYGLELVAGGHSVTMANPQDFYVERMRPLLANGLLDRYFEATYDVPTRRLTQVGLDPVALHSRLSAVLGIPLPESLEAVPIVAGVVNSPSAWTVREGVTPAVFLSQLRTFLEAVLARVDELRRNGRFVLHRMMVETAFNTRELRDFDLVIDTLDALTYSSVRLYLLEQFRQRLRARARGFAVIPAGDFVRLRHQASLRLFADAIAARGEPIVTLVEYVTGRAPEHYRLLPREGVPNPERTNQTLRGQFPIAGALAITGGGRRNLFSNVRQTRVWLLDQGPIVRVPIVEYEEF